MFQVGVERAVLARNVRRTLRQGKDPRCTLGNRRGPRPPHLDLREQGRPIGHATVKYVV